MTFILTHSNGTKIEEGAELITDEGKIGIYRGITPDGTSLILEGIGSRRRNEYSIAEFGTLNIASAPPAPTPPWLVYKSFTSNGTEAPHSGDPTALDQHKRQIDKHGGWIEDHAGNVIYGKRHAGTIDLTPTWKGMLPALIALIQDGGDAGRKIAREELQHMAEAADAYNVIRRPGFK